MLFYNGGAFLTTEGSESLEDLRFLEESGVEILTCGTCLNHYGLADKLAVGQVTNMYEIAERDDPRFPHREAVTGGERMQRKRETLVVVRGGGDIATGTIQKLWNSGFGLVILETDRPTAIRRKVALSQAVYEGTATVEELTAARIESTDEIEKEWEKGRIPLLVDPECRCLEDLKPLALVDAILAKKNLGTHRKIAKYTIALGPGFTAGADVDLVIETMRGHSLGRIIREGSAMPNTGVPGIIAGYGKERVVHAPADGTLHILHDIGDSVEKGEPLGLIGEVKVPAPLSGLLRGILPDGFAVTKGLKMADVDPRLSEYANCFTISDKARCIGGGVLEGLLSLMREGEE